MIDIVIPLGKGSKWQDNELKYALRSVEQYVKDAGKVWIVGEKPGFLNYDVVGHIPYKDVEQKEANIMNKTRQACLHPEVSADFLFSNDDIFFSHPTKASLPYYRRSQALSECVKPKGKPLGAYQVSMWNTIEALKARGLNDYHFDIHAPIVYNKDTYIDTMSMYDWTVPKGYVIKSLYANTLGIEGEILEDVKVRTYLNLSQIVDIFVTSQFVSVGDNGLNIHMRGELERRFNTKSKYEI